MINTVPAPRFTYDPETGAPEGAKAAWEEAGCLILEGFVSEQACDNLMAAADRLSRELVEAADGHAFDAVDNQHADEDYFLSSGDVMRAFMEERVEGVDRVRAVNKLGHAMHDLDPVFDRFSRSPELAEAAKRIGFVEPALLQSMYIFKPPNIGGEVICHQDSTYIYTEPESCVGFWFALEDATIENGCMQFIPGGHKLPLKKRNYRGANGKLVTETLDDTPWPEEQKVPVEAKAGTLVIFDGRAPHMSAANRSPKSRHAYTLHVIDQNCRYPAKNWLQRSADLPLRGVE